MKEIYGEKTYYADIYLRLSREDGDKEESDSIANQREYIKSFLSGKKDIQIFDERVDDGFSGVSFQRPAFQKMLQDIYAGRVNCIVVKDLSRFGRNFVEVGRYIDDIFPHLGVRFIAINDGYDSATEKSYSDYILLPFKNLINDAFCRDISIKVRSQLEIKRKKGEFIGSFAVYGYLKDANDRHKLVVDDYAASIVKDIFKWKLQGSSQQKIANRLNELGVLSPLEYKRFCGMKYATGFQIYPKGKWTAVAVGRILRNECYIGTLVQGKRTTPNHKIKKTIYKPETDWIRVINSQPPIISQDEFDRVQTLLAYDTRVAPKKETVHLFSGLIFCGDCYQNLIRNPVYKNKKRYIYYMCGTNRATKKCTSHRIGESLLYDAVLSSLQQHLKHILETEKFVQRMEGFSLYEEDTEKYDIQIEKKQKEIEKYQALKATLYEALQDDIITKEEYYEFKNLYDNKIDDAKKVMEKLQKEKDMLYSYCREKAVWSEQFSGYKNLKDIDHHMLVALVDKIYVYEDYRIEIVFRYSFHYEKSMIA